MSTTRRKQPAPAAPPPGEMPKTKSGIPTPYLTEDEAAQYIRAAVGTLQWWRRNGDGPAFRKHGSLVLYKIADLDAWSDQHVRRSTSDVPGVKPSMEEPGTPSTSAPTH